MPPRYILAPYLATPLDVVAQMLDFADVGAGDLVFDLGCGDGRLAIAAALRGAQACGVDIEPWWVEQAQLNAASAGVAERVRFAEQDAFEVELGEATVVCVYLVHWSTQRVAEHLGRHCRSGTRVISHSFGFDGLPSTSRRFVDAGGQPRELHRWVVGGSDGAAR